MHYPYNAHNASHLTSLTQPQKHVPRAFQSLKAALTASIPPLVFRVQMVTLRTLSLIFVALALNSQGVCCVRMKLRVSTVAHPTTWTT